MFLLVWLGPHESIFTTVSKIASNWHPTRPMLSLSLSLFLSLSIYIYIQHILLQVVKIDSFLYLHIHYICINSCFSRVLQPHPATTSDDSRGSGVGFSSEARYWQESLLRALTDGVDFGETKTWTMVSTVSVVVIFKDLGGTIQWFANRSWLGFRPPCKKVLKLLWLCLTFILHSFWRTTIQNEVCWTARRWYFCGVMASRVVIARAIWYCMFLPKVPAIFIHFGPKQEVNIRFLD